MNFTQVYSLQRPKQNVLVAVTPKRPVNELIISLKNISATEADTKINFSKSTFLGIIGKRNRNEP